MVADGLVPTSYSTLMVQLCHNTEMELIILEEIFVHDYVKWKHFLCYWPFVSGIPVTGGFPSQSKLCRALMFSLICAWTNHWANNQDAGDLRWRSAHYDVTVMSLAVWEFVKATISIVASKENFIKKTGTSVSVYEYYYILLPLPVGSTNICPLPVYYFWLDVFDFHGKLHSYRLIALYSADNYA